MKKGTHHSESVRKQISGTVKEAWNKGLLNNKGCFKKGHKTWNKGIHKCLSPNSTWKKGDTAMQKHPQWKGGIQRPTHDCVHLTIGEGQRIRRPRAVFEKQFGKIPKGFVIYHIDQNKHNDNPTNLKAVSRAELMKLNSHGQM